MALFPQPLDKEEFERRAWNSVVSREPELSAHGYGDAFRTRAEELRAAGDQIGADAFRALADVLLLHLSPSDKALPFKPVAIWGDRRSLALDDLDGADIQLLEEIGPLAAAPIVRAQLCDVAWVAGRARGRKTWTLGPVAAKAYLNAFELAHGVGKELVLFDELTRGLQLAREFRKQDSQAPNDYWNVLEQVARKTASKGSIGLLARVLRLFAERRYEKSTDLAILAEGTAKNVAAKGPSITLADLWGEISSLWRVAKNDVSARSAGINRGEMLIAVGEAEAGRSAMVAFHWVQQGLECLRRTGADTTRIEEVHRRLLDLGAETLSEMKEVRKDFDATEAIESSRKQVAGYPLAEALLRFAFGEHLLDPVQLRKTVEEQAKQSPLQFLIEAKTISRDGKTVGIRPSLMSTGEEYERAIGLAVIEHAFRYDVPFRVQLFIIPAKDQIWNDHHPGFADLLPLVKDNPFVPAGFEEGYLRGLVAGFFGDWIVAAYFLIPQVEASVRHVLQRAGAITSNVQADGNQEEKKLHQLFADPVALQAFGAPLLFELRSLLIEELGGNLRNRFAHGMMTAADCYAADVITLWWLLLRICLTPVAHAQKQQQDSSGQPPVGDDQGNAGVSVANPEFLDFIDGLMGRA